MSLAELSHFLNPMLHYSNIPLYHWDKATPFRSEGKNTSVLQRLHGQVAPGLFGKKSKPAHLWSNSLLYRYRNPGDHPDYRMGTCGNPLI